MRKSLAILIYSGQSNATGAIVHIHPASMLGSIFSEEMKPVARRRIPSRINANIASALNNRGSSTSAYGEATMKGKDATAKGRKGFVSRQVTCI